MQVHSHHSLPLLHPDQTLHREPPVLRNPDELAVKFLLHSRLARQNPQVAPVRARDHRPLVALVQGEDVVAAGKAGEEADGEARHIGRALEAGGALDRLAAAVFFPLLITRTLPSVFSE